MLIEFSRNFKSIMHARLQHVKSSVPAVSTRESVYSLFVGMILLITLEPQK